MKCPSCGAIINSIALKCPECGYVFSEESESSQRIRSDIQSLQERLSAVNTPLEKASVIGSFTLPNTEEGLMCLLEFAFSSFERSNGFEDETVSSAWLEKARLSYQMLKTRAGSDKKVLSKLERFAFLEEKEKTPKVKISNTKKKKRTVTRWILVTSIVAFAIYLFLLILSSLEEPSSEKTTRHEVMELIQEGKYDQARVKAMETEYSWDQKELLELIDNAENQ